LKYDLASSPLLFKAVVFPLFQRRVRNSGAPRSIEHVRIETTSLNSSLTSRPSFAAFAEWSRKLGKIDGWLADRRGIALVYRRWLGKHMVSANTAKAVIDGSCFVNFPVIVPEALRDDICRDMMLSGFDVGRSLYPNVHRLAKFADVAGASGKVDRLTYTSIYLPTHFGVSVAYAEALAARLAELCG
jgi:dTDP-4-amino-4,6-dideoxygalactose transaminase